MPEHDNAKRQTDCQQLGGEKRRAFRHFAQELVDNTNMQWLKESKKKINNF